mmetsp:Transcript_45381/g.98869  ORF Transcript_45381/g.98869 Transcript_45381/m.98869 type:complete len:222 (+) Transcript_45381:264-929(+)
MLSQGRRARTLGQERFGKKSDSEQRHTETTAAPSLLGAPLKAPPEELSTDMHGALPLAPPGPLPAASMLAVPLVASLLAVPLAAPLMSGLSEVAESHPGCPSPSEASGLPSASAISSARGGTAASANLHPHPSVLRPMPLSTFKKTAAARPTAQPTHSTRLGVKHCCCSLFRLPLRSVPVPLLPLPPSALTTSSPAHRSEDSKVLVGELVGSGAKSEHSTV